MTKLSLAWPLSFFYTNFSLTPPATDMVLQTSVAYRAQMTVGQVSKPPTSWKTEEGGAGEPYLLCCWAGSYGTAKETTAFWLPACSAHGSQGKSRNGHPCFFLWHLKNVLWMCPPFRRTDAADISVQLLAFLTCLIQGTEHPLILLIPKHNGEVKMDHYWQPWYGRNLKWQKQGEAGAEGRHWRFLEALLLPCLKWERKEDVFGYI